jgi:hypothetical protein
MSFVSKMNQTRSLACAVLAAAGIAAPVIAQCGSISITGVPDFDQRRSALPNNGNMYCVPTAALNWMAYFRNRGVSRTMGYTSSNWASSSNYSHVSGRLAEMGDQMDTSGSGGTGTSDAVEGIADYMDFYNVTKPFMILGYVADDDWAPSPRGMRWWMANQGGFVMMIYGRYDLDGSEWERDGGHCVTLVKVNDPCATNPTIGFRDPWTGNSDSNASQSDFTTREWQVRAKVADYDGDVRTQWEPVGQSGTTNRPFIDKQIIILPLFVFSSSGRGTTLTKHSLTPLVTSTNPRVTNIRTPDIASFISAQPHVLTPGLYATLSQSRSTAPSLRFYDEIEDTWTTMATFTSDPVALLADRNGAAWVIGDGSIRQLKILPGERARTLQTRAFPSAIHSLAISDATDDLLVLARDRRTISTFIDGNLASTPVETPLPTGVILGGEPSLTFNPLDGSIWITSENSASAWQLTRAATANVFTISATVPLSNWPGRTNLQFDGDGMMSFSAGGQIVELVRDPLSGRFIVNPNPIFAGLPSDGAFGAARSRTNFDPARHATLAFRNIEDPPTAGEEFPNCPADYNGNNTVDFFDYLDFVQDFSNEDFKADINFNLTVDFFDYLDFVEFFDAGC